MNDLGTMPVICAKSVPLEEPSYVYMIYSAGKIKIGTSRDPLQRIDKLRTANAEPLNLVWIAFGDRRTEDHLHAAFKADRLHGEWFRLSDALRDFIIGSSTEKAPFASMLRSAIEAKPTPPATGRG